MDWIGLDSIKLDWLGLAWLDFFFCWCCLSIDSQEDLEELDESDEYYDHLTEEDFEEIDAMLSSYSDRVSRLAGKIADQDAEGRCGVGTRERQAARGSMYNRVIADSKESRRLH